MKNKMSWGYAGAAMIALGVMLSYQNEEDKRLFSFPLLVVHTRYRDYV
jgi:hypothetical protein